jgi:3-methyladenine DNA glycosylase AlkD
VSDKKTSQQFIHRFIMTTQDIIKKIHSLQSPERKAKQAHFKIGDVNSYGLTMPQIRSIAKEIGKNHPLAMELWSSGIHEARHIATMIADKKQFSEALADQWLMDFNSWDIVDGFCSIILCKMPFAYTKAIEWTKQKGEFQKRAGFAGMAMIAVHDKKAGDDKFTVFYPYLLKESHDDRNFVKKAISWAIRSIGKRNAFLAKEMIELSEAIREKEDTASKWIASDAIRELKNKYV